MCQFEFYLGLIFPLSFQVIRNLQKKKLIKKKKIKTKGKREKSGPEKLSPKYNMKTKKKKTTAQSISLLGVYKNCLIYCNKMSKAKPWEIRVFLSQLVCWLWRLKKNCWLVASKDGCGVVLMHAYSHPICTHITASFDERTRQHKYAYIHVQKVQLK